MKTITASDANRHFSGMLRNVSKGEVYTVVSRGKPVATVNPVTTDRRKNVSARNILIDRLKNVPVSGARNWNRNELYDR